MKKIVPLILFIIFTGLLYFSNDMEYFIDNSHQGANIQGDESIINMDCSAKNSTLYKIWAELKVNENYLTISEDIHWFNDSEYSTNEIQFHFYANGYKSNNTLFAKQYFIDRESITESEIKSVSVDGNLAELVYFQPDINNSNDSTVAKIFFDNAINPGDTVRIHFDYKLKIPRSINSFGYASGRDFFLISQWFPKIGVYENGEWICSQYHPYTKFYSDFADYNVTLNIPNEYKIAATGNLINITKTGGRTEYQFEQKCITDFAWIASNEILFLNETYIRDDGSKIQLNFMLQPERENYYERYLLAVKNSLAYLESNIGKYPFTQLTLVDVPRTSSSEEMDIPTLFTVRTDLFSPDDGKELELQTIRGLTHQYLNSIFAINEVYEAWLGQGIAYYLSEKIIAEYYGKRNLSFRLANYFPIYGLNFLSHYEIPLIYTLGTYKYQEDSESMSVYLQHPSLCSIADTSFLLPNDIAYNVNTIYKPQLMLLSLERYIGRERINKIFKDYYKQFRYRHPDSEDFFNIVQNNTDEDLTWFVDNIYKEPYTFDYKINYVKQVKADEYEIFVERQGEGYFKSEIAFYTDKDTLYQAWDGKERWKKFVFKTSNEVYGAEIDPGMKNVLDKNYANNSYAMGGRYVASFSLAMRVFFWIQNALLILGSIG